MKKKIIAMSLALVVVAGVGKGIVASAATNYNQSGTADGTWTLDEGISEIENNITEDTGAKASKDVKVTFADSYTKTYSVDITWGALTASNVNSSGTWDPVTHTYSAPSITVSGDTINVKNNSDAQVNCTFAFEKESSLATNFPNNNITGSMAYSDTYDEILSSAIGYTDTDASSNKYTDHTDLKTQSKLTLSGALNETKVGEVTVGKVIVTLTD